MKQNPALHKIPLVLCLLAVVLAMASCQSNEDKDLLPPIGYSPEAFAALEGDERVQFVKGWYDVESGTTGQSWRWMSKQGEIHLRNQGKDMKLRLLGWVPLDLLPAPPTLRITINGKELEQLTPPKGHFTREYKIPSSLQGTGEKSMLLIESSAAAKPPQDTRELGYSLVNIVWEAQ